MAPSSNAASDLLTRVNWDFPNSSALGSNVHSMHWFPGNFIPQIPSFLIQILSDRNNFVLDPFCGSGTTGVEAIRLGRSVRMSDVNRASIQVATGKCVIFSDHDLPSLLHEMLDKVFWEFDSFASTSPNRTASRNAELKTWFHPETLRQLENVWAITQAASSIIRPLLEVVFTDVLFACSSTNGAKTQTGKRRRHHWGWIADNVRPKAFSTHEPLELFKNRLMHISTYLQFDRRDNDARFEIKHEDAKAISLSDSCVDLIVTSPPYLGMIDYTLANRLTYLWMNWSLEDEFKCEIGARRNRNKPSAVSEYLADMEKVVIEMHRVLKPCGYCALIVGSSRKYLHAVDELIAICQRYFSIVWGPHPRTSTRRRVSDRSGTAPSEYIVVMSK